MESLTDMVFSQGSLLELNIGKWSGELKATPADLGFDKNSRDNLQHVSLGTVHLIDPKALHNLNVKESEVRAFFYRNSNRFPVGGSRFLFSKRLQTVTSELLKIRAEWNLLVADLVSKYPALRDAQASVLKKNLDALYINKNQEETKLLALARIAASYPTEAEITQRCYIRWNTYHIKSGAVGQANQGVSDELDAQLRDWVLESSHEEHVSLGDVAKNVLELLRKNNHLTSKNVRPLAHSIENFEANSFLLGSGAHSLIQKLRYYFVISPGGAVDAKLTAERLKGPEVEALFESIAGLADRDVADNHVKVSLAKLGTPYQRLLSL